MKRLVLDVSREAGAFPYRDRERVATSKQRNPFIPPTA